MHLERLFCAEKRGKGRSRGTPGIKWLGGAPLQCLSLPAAEDGLKKANPLQGADEPDRCWGPFNGKRSTGWVTVMVPRV